jgi:hypothetical protein
MTGLGSWGWGFSRRFGLMVAVAFLKADAMRLLNSEKWFFASLK